MSRWVYNRSCLSFLGINLMGDVTTWFLRVTDFLSKFIIASLLIWFFFVIYFYLNKNSVKKFPLGFSFFVGFSISHSCCSISHQQETSRFHIGNCMIMFVRWVRFPKTRNPITPSSCLKYLNYAKIMFRYELTILRYLGCHQQPLWSILRWLYHDHVELEPSCQHFSSFHLCILQLSKCKMGHQMVHNNCHSRRWSEHCQWLRQLHNMRFWKGFSLRGKGQNYRTIQGELDDQSVMFFS